MGGCVGCQSCGSCVGAEAAARGCGAVETMETAWSYRAMELWGGL
jgi:hypothetical protein